MYYFDAKSDLTFFNSFKNEVNCFNASTVVRNEYNRLGYLDKKDQKTVSEAEGIIKKLREAIAKKLARAIEISTKYGISTSVFSIPPPIIGGPFLPVNIYEAILNDNSYGRTMTPELIMDTINQTIGQIELQKKKDVRSVFNPFFWLKLLFVKVVRIPFLILSASGFNVQKIEEHFISKLFKFFEAVLIIWILLKYGLDQSEVKNALIKFVLE